MTEPNFNEESADERATTPAIRTRQSCQSFTAGHRVPWVQAQRARRADPPDHYIECEIIDASDDGWITVVLSSTGESIRFWNHEPQRLRHLVGLAGLEINPRWSILCRRYSGGRDTFVSLGRTCDTCVFEEPTIDPAQDLADALFDRLQTHGGFTISGPEALRLLGEQRDRDTT